MMKMKKLISSLLAVLMLVASLNITLVSAADYTELELDYADKVQAANIMTGTENGMDLDSTLTRAQAATIMIRLKGVAGTGNLPTAPTKFSDVPADHWASGNINRAVEMGLVKGTTDTTFAPEALVTIAELTTMAVRALGAGTAVELLPTAWPVNYMNFAAENDITKNVYNSYTEKATRMITAIIAGNTLEAYMWKYNSVLGTDKGLTQTTETLLQNVLKFDWYKNELITGIDLKDRILTTTSISYEVADRINLAGYTIGQEVDIWYNRTAKEIVRVGLPEATKRTIVAFESIESFVGIDSTGKNTKSVKVSIDGKVKEYSFAASGSVYFNGTETSWDDSGATTLASIDFTTFNNAKTNAMGRVVLDGNKVKILDATVYTDAIVVDRVSGETIYADSEALEISGNSLNLKDKDVLIINAEGKELKMTDIKAGDFILYTITAGSPSKYRLMVINNSVEGKTTIVGAKYVRIGSKTYEIDDNVLSTSDFGAMNIGADDELQLFLNLAGKIVALKKVDGDVSTSYGIVTWAKAVTNKYGEVALELELTYFDGTTTGIKELDLTKTNTALGATESFSAGVGSMPAPANNTANKLGQALLGQVVKFRNGTKFEINEISTATANWTAAQDKLDAFTTAKFDVDNKKIQGTGILQTARVNSSTKVAFVKVGTGTDASFKNTVEFIEWSTLKDKDYAGTDNFVAVSQNSSTGIISALVICRGVNVSRDFTANFGFVKAMSNPDRNDIVTIAIITPNGLVEYTIEYDELPAGFTSAATTVGKMIEYTVSGTKLGEVTFKARTAVSNHYQVVRFNSSTARIADFANCANGEIHIVGDPSVNQPAVGGNPAGTHDGHAITSVTLTTYDLAKNFFYVKSDDTTAWDRSVAGSQDEIDMISINSSDEIVTLGADVRIYLNADGEIAMMWYQR